MKTFFAKKLISVSQSPTLFYQRDLAFRPSKIQLCDRAMIIPVSRLRAVPTNSKVFLRGFLNMREKQILTSVSINTQVIIQNRALSLARYLGLSADNHLDGQNGCQYSFCHCKLKIISR